MLSQVKGIREGALFLWLFGSRPAGGVKARGRCGNGDSGAAFPPFQQPAGRARNPPAIESAEKPSTWRKRGTDLPGFPTFRQAPGQSRNPPPIEMLKTPSSRETIGRRGGTVPHCKYTGRFGDLTAYWQEIVSDAVYLFRLGESEECDWLVLLGQPWSPYSPDGIR